MYRKTLQIIKAGGGNQKERTAAPTNRRPVYVCTVAVMKEKKHTNTENLRLCPQERLCPIFDRHSIFDEMTSQKEKMGVAVLDNCAEEHIQ